MLTKGACTFVASIRVNTTVYAMVFNFTLIDICKTSYKFLKTIYLFKTVNGINKINIQHYLDTHLEYTRFPGTLQYNYNDTLGGLG